MKINKIIALAGIALAATTFQSCQKFYDINESPNNMQAVPVTQLLPSITSAVGYMGVSDLYRYSGVISQQFTGNTTNLSQTFKLYEQYRINNSDVNNQWSNMYSVALADIGRIIPQAEAEGNVHFAGVAKILKAYIFQLLVDAWGDVPYSESGQFLDNLTPKFDKGEDIYASLITLLDQGVVDMNAASSTFSPTTFTTIYSSSDWNANKLKWTKFANTLKLRLYIHYSKKDPAFAQTKINDLINSGALFMTSTADNFQMQFLSESGRRNPNQSIEGGQFRNAWYPNKKIVDMMNAKTDPRRSSYFVPFPFNSNPATYKGGTATDAASVAYSRLNTFLKGAISYGTVVVNPDGTVTDNSVSWNGAAPARLLTFAEYNFIRAEAASRYGITTGGTAEQFFQAGIRASMTDAGVPVADIDAYIAANGTLAGNISDIEKIINEKYVANWGVVMESWSDWRRTGFPTLTPVPDTDLGAIPRSLVYPQSETNSNPNTPVKANGMLTRVFWDTAN